MKQLLLVFLVGSAMAGCGPSTKIVKTWQEPNATLQVSPSNKTLTVAMIKDETSRRIVEDQLVKLIGPTAIAS